MCARHAQEGGIRRALRSFPEVDLSSSCCATRLSRRQSAFAARHLRRLGRDAALAGIDSTDYSLSATARSFVPFYAQRISHNIVMHGAQGILIGIHRARNVQLRGASVAA